MKIDIFNQHIETKLFKYLYNLYKIILTPIFYFCLSILYLSDKNISYLYLIIPIIFLIARYLVIRSSKFTITNKFTNTFFIIEFILLLLLFLLINPDAFIKLLGLYLITIFYSGIAAIIINFFPNKYQSIQQLLKNLLYPIVLVICFSYPIYFTINNCSGYLHGLIPKKHYSIIKRIKIPTASFNKISFLKGGDSIIISDHKFQAVRSYSSNFSPGYKTENIGNKNRYFKEKYQDWDEYYQIKIDDKNDDVKFKKIDPDKDLEESIYLVEYIDLIKFKNDYLIVNEKFKIGPFSSICIYEKNSTIYIAYSIDSFLYIGILNI